ncbi:hypothetical protein AVEN_42860-1 [Araneus ventricosus]|uniref:Uncharacterized protein n=1 Tax=Araneus ventricosus TaxID=182803 RepID=A0A4Y2AF30_ARAVE|nr:hypothetical protein AVEN_42860-1 [Araneus ventricosus]
MESFNGQLMLLEAAHSRALSVLKMAGRVSSLPMCNGFLADKGVVSQGDPPNESGEANDPVGALTASPRRSSEQPAGYESTFLLPHEEFCGLSVGAPVFNRSE